METDEESCLYAVESWRNICDDHSNWLPHIRAKVHRDSVLHQKKCGKSNHRYVYCHNSNECIKCTIMNIITNWKVLCVFNEPFKTTGAIILELL